MKITDGKRTVISIHALLAESDQAHGGNQHHDMISIHALLAESDLHTNTGMIFTLRFLSTLSLRRATLGVRMVLPDPGAISIHALLAESD